MALGSCHYVNQEGYERSTGGYGANMHIFTHINARTPDVMLWLGDNVYLREPDWNSRSGIFKRYSHTRALPEIQPLLARTAHYATWDDHDYGPNDSDRGWFLKNDARDAFMAYWPNPSYGRDGQGIYTQFALADVDVILLDDRWWRSPDHRKDEPRTMLGAEQFSWLIDVLHASTATFKLIAIGSQVLTDNLRKECYARMPEERQKLLDAITASGVKGVMLLSGDIHASELSKLDRPGAYPLYEFTCSSLTAGNNKDIDQQSNTYRVPGTTVGINNFGMITVTGAAKQRKLILRVIDHEGNERWVRELSETELR
jgi:alkaline phosphatase D